VLEFLRRLRRRRWFGPALAWWIAEEAQELPGIGIPQALQVKVLFFPEAIHTPEV
jgi:hypothetical protein